MEAAPPAPKVPKEAKEPLFTALLQRAERAPRRHVSRACATELAHLRALERSVVRDGMEIRAGFRLLCRPKSRLPKSPVVRKEERRQLARAACITGPRAWPGRRRSARLVEVANAVKAGCLQVDIQAHGTAVPPAGQDGAQPDAADGGQGGVDASSEPGSTPTLPVTTGEGEASPADSDHQADVTEKADEPKPLAADGDQRPDAAEKTDEPEPEPEPSAALDDQQSDAPPLADASPPARPSAPSQIKVEKHVALLPQLSISFPRKRPADACTAEGSASKRRKTTGELAVAGDGGEKEADAPQQTPGALARGSASPVVGSDDDGRQGAASVSRKLSFDSESVLVGAIVGEGAGNAALVAAVEEISRTVHAAPAAAEVLLLEKSPADVAQNELAPGLPAAGLARNDEVAIAIVSLARGQEHLAASPPAGDGATRTDEAEAAPAWRAAQVVLRNYPKLAPAENERDGHADDAVVDAGAQLVAGNDEPLPAETDPGRTYARYRRHRRAPPDSTAEAQTDPSPAPEPAPAARVRPRASYHRLWRAPASLAGVAPSQASPQTGALASGVAQSAGSFARYRRL